MSGAAAYVTFNELVELLGEADAVRLVSSHGGTRLYVPRTFKPESPVVAAIGVKKAATLAEDMTTGIGGLWIELPRGPAGMMADYRRRLAALVADQTLSEPEIARKLRIAGRTVRRERARQRRANDGGQGELF